MIGLIIAVVVQAWLLFTVIRDSREMRRFIDEADLRELNFLCSEVEAARAAHGRRGNDDECRR